MDCGGLRRGTCVAGEARAATSDGQIWGENGSSPSCGDSWGWSVLFLASFSSVSHTPLHLCAFWPLRGPGHYPGKEVEKDGGS